MKIVNYVVCLMLLLTYAVHAASQAYEIRLVNKGANSLGVEMRKINGASPKTADYITDLVFGIKWKGSGQDLAGNLVTSYGIKKSGVRSQKNDYYYQAFYADPVGYNTPVNWQQNSWVEILSVTLMGTGIGLFNITEKGFDVTTDPNFALNFTDYTPAIAGNGIQGPLPVDLIRFDAAPVNQMIQVLWTTGNEQNGRGFQVQRADEREPDNFRDIGWVDSKGNDKSTGKNEYTYIDRDVVAKLRYKYRLKQIDQEDRFRFSEIRMAMVDELDNAAINIAPNPADKLLQILFNSAVESENVVIKVIDARGAVVITRNQYISAGLKIELNVMLLADGTYFLLVEGRNGVLYKKVFKKG